MANVEIRSALMKYGIRHWKLAEALGISETHFSRKLRHELPPQEREKILAIIEDLAKEAE